MSPSSAFLIGATVGLLPAVVAHVLVLARPKTTAGDMMLASVFTVSATLLTISAGSLLVDLGVIP